jgi:hypothetical protein
VRQYIRKACLCQLQVPEAPDRSLLFETRGNFLRDLENRYNLPAWSCSFKHQKVFREALNHEDIVDCVEIDAADALSNRSTAVDMLKQWMAFEDLEYYRLYERSTGRLLYYDQREAAGLSTVFSYESCFDAQDAMNISRVTSTSSYLPEKVPGTFV